MLLARRRAIVHIIYLLFSKTIPHRDRDAVKLFCKEVRRAQHALVRQCFVTFYNKGGAILKLQTGRQVHFTRCYIMAIYGDAPAIAKCTLTGSACPVCFTPRRVMSDEPAGFDLRCPASVYSKRAEILNARNLHGRGANEEAVSMSRELGVRLDVDNPWSPENAPDDEWVFGPDAALDNVWQACPQVSLHGMDEGLVQKLNFGALCTGIEDARCIHSVTKTQVYIRFWQHV